MKKIALFKNIELDYETIGEECLDGSRMFVRVSEYLDCEFVLLSDRIGIEVAMIDRQIATVTEEFSRKLDMLNDRKSQLLAITQDVAA
jgi:hypothetical protein